MKTRNFTLRNSILLVLVSFSLVMSGQVGINTTNPQAVFHVDGMGNNPETGIPSTVQQGDDLVVTSSGNVGVGVISPTTKLELKTNGTSATPVPAIKITDGSAISKVHSAFSKLYFMPN